MIAWCDVGDIRVAAIFKRKGGVNRITRSKWQYNQQTAFCAIHRRRWYNHRVVFRAAQNNMEGDTSRRFLSRDISK